MSNAVALLQRTVLPLVMVLLLTVVSAGTFGLRIAAVGDFGVDNDDHARVAGMVSAWGVNDVLALGDCNYDFGEAATIDANVGQYYSRFMSPYKGNYGSGSRNGNHFWPVPGNHDYGQTCSNFRNGCSPSSCESHHGADAYKLYMPVGGKTFYNQLLGGGLVEIFALDSNCNQPAGTDHSSAQAQWLRDQLALSSATWKFVIMHHAPYSSGKQHGSIKRMQWPFKAWGADAVMAGHTHAYERIIRDGLLYIVNGAGGNELYGWGSKAWGSKVRYNSDNGAQLIEVDSDSATFRFYAASRTSPYSRPIDCIRITKGPTGNSMRTCSQINSAAREG